MNYNWASAADRDTRPTLISRRDFLGTVLAGSLLAAAPLRAFSAGGESRELKFLHTHTGESLTTTYFATGKYVPDSLARIDHLLRDFRSGEAHTIDPALLDLLHELKMLADPDGTYEIISAYRSPQTNAMLRSRSNGVAEQSLHMQGKAIDVRLTGFPTDRLHQLALSMRRGGVGFYEKLDFIHVDTGRVRSW